MAKVGLRRNLTFEDAIDAGEELDFSHIYVTGRGASRYMSGFFYTPPDEEIASETHDEKHEQVLASMRAAAAELERANEAHRAQARQSFRGAMPTHHGVHERAAQTEAQSSTQSAQTDAPRTQDASTYPRPGTARSNRGMQATASDTIPMRGTQTTFAERMRTRSENPIKFVGATHVRSDFNLERQRARQRAERQSTLINVRQTPYQPRDREGDIDMDDDMESI